MKTLAVLFACALPLSLMAPPDVKLEDSGDRRVQKDAMHFKPVDAAVWSKLSGDKVDPATFKDKVVLIVSWSSWYKTSHGALKTAQTLSDKFGKDGLVVIGIHHEKGFDNAAKVMTDQGAKFLTAHDADGSFRKAMVIDQDPDFFIIDRAGNMRYADVDTGSVEAAVEFLVSETPTDAAEFPKKLKDDAAKKEADSRKTKEAGVQPGKVLNVPFELPEASAFDNAKWPDHNTQELAAMNVQGQALPASLGNEKFLTEKPNWEGRVLVLDFWATWCGPCRRAMPMLDKLQQDNTADLVVLGISDEPENTVRKFLSSKAHGYSNSTDTGRTVNNALQIRGIPHVVVMSTDGTVRWQGNPLDPKFKKVVEDVIKVDPGVKARQAAEAEFLKKQKKI
jgi:thiol-disulfide isomerase/thioredoxin